MTLRLRLFLLVAGLVVLLVIAQALLVRSLAARLDRDVHTVAVSVGEEILSGFVFKTDQGAEGEVETDTIILRSSGEPESAVDPGAGEVGTLRSDDLAVWEQRIDPGVPPEMIVESEVSEAAPGAEPKSALDSSLDPKRDPARDPARGATWLQHERLEVVAFAPGSEPRRFFEEKVVFGGETTGAAPDGSVRTASGQRMKRPFVVPDGHGALLLRGPQIERRIPLPSAPFASTLDQFSSELTIGSLVLLTLGLLAAAVVAHRTTRPLGRLAAAAERVGGGELGAIVPLDEPVTKRDEIGAAIASFNAMSERLAALDRENRRLAESEHLTELAEVARGLAHTLRNPLNALGLAVERLAEEGDREKAAELAERSRRQIRRIDGSLRSFLALASAPGAATSEPVELGALARETALEALHDASGKVRIEVEAPERIEIAAVAAEVKAVVQALLVNACEASPEGGKVVVRVARDAEGGARVEIDDEGAGVAPEIAGRLFAPHVTTKPHGSGMGLYLAQRLATHRYGGGVTLEPRETRGTRATIRLTDRKAAAA